MRRAEEKIVKRSDGPVAQADLNYEVIRREGGGKEPGAQQRLESGRGSPLVSMITCRVFGRGGVSTYLPEHAAPVS